MLDVDRSDLETRARLTAAGVETGETAYDLPIIRNGDYNVRLRLNAAGAQGEIYAKVTAVAGADTFVLRFTSVDPAAARILEAALRG